MSYDERNLLEVLRAELTFLDSGGYEKDVPHWRAGLIFEDSPTCLNHGNPEHRRACSECLLSHMVPREDRFKRVPCRHISLDSNGVTLDDMYRTGTQAETKEAVRKWLTNTIAQMEKNVPKPQMH